jgi:hypothetical protein
MAIKIPSKNIYEIQNPKIRDNVVDNVSVEQTVIKPNNEYDTSVYNEKFLNFTLDAKKESADWNISATSSGSYPNVSTTEYYVYAYVQPSYIRNYYIKIPKRKDNYTLVNEVFFGLDKNETPNIKHTIFYNLETYSVSAYMERNFDDIDNSSLSNEELEIYSSVNGSGELPEIKAEISTKGATTITAIATQENESNFGTVEVKEYDEYFDLTLTILAQLKIKELKGETTYSLNTGSQNVTRPISGYLKVYNPKSVEITLYGNTIGIDLTDGSITYGSGNKPHSLSGNELLQDSGSVNSDRSATIKPTKIVDNSVYFSVQQGQVNIGDKVFGGVTVAENNNELYFDTNYSSSFKIGEEYDTLVDALIASHLANNVLTQYAKGKETATLLCDIANYYNESGEKVIDTKTNKMSFRLHDQVIPYVFGENGQDKPMSKYQDGSAKVFEVVGSNIIYDGAVWQELNLQEISQNT